MPPWCDRRYCEVTTATSTTTAPRTVESKGIEAFLSVDFALSEAPRLIEVLAAQKTYPEQVTVAESDEAEEMLRRQFEHLLALGAAAAFGGVVPGVGELAPDMPRPGLPGDLPTRVGMVDVAVLRGYRDSLQAVSRTYGGQARAAVVLADWSDQWLAVDASDAVRHALLGELVHVHTITAWCCHDGGAPGRSLYHFGRAVELATDASDSYQAAYALRHAAVMLVERGRPNDALKAAQLAGVRVLGAPRGDSRVPVLQAWCHAVSALALSRLDESDSVRGQARNELATARGSWEPPDTRATANGSGQTDMDLVSALTWLHCGQLDAAERVASLSAHTYGAYRRPGVVADITRARLHVLNGDTDALRLVESAINATTQTRSGVARQVWLPPLAEALDNRPGADARDLARQARQIATTRA
ncbi:MAG: hypothetical protein ACRDUV_20285 [Pseudonocardiaceae bacterium]